MLRPVFLSMPALLAASGSGSGEGGSEAAVAEAVENALRPPPSVVDDDEEAEGEDAGRGGSETSKVVLFVDGIDGVATPPGTVRALLRAIDRRGGGGEQGVVAAVVAAVAAEYRYGDAEEEKAGGGDGLVANTVPPAMAAVLGRCHARHGLPWLREWKGEILPTLAAVLEGMMVEGNSGALVGAPALAAKLREKEEGGRGRMSLRGLEGAARLFAARSLVRAQRRAGGRGGGVEDEKAALGLLQVCVESAWL